ncbi:cytochrome c-type biogenesis protein [Nitrosomonas sp. JL21]|uniref:cytochrome c-type biogenesis protein n=1 Tax=Nitrosomonas sp. JL21 TaxID=153949 RepID=UPI001F037B29|nr:cytochrome c-type biogenesis protein [Nitrosomonas sp. JL21]
MLFLLVIIPSLALSKEAIPVAEDPEVEKRMLALTMDLRCLVCQNESIADSRADFSNDIRREIREQIKANKSDPEIVQFLVDRYGDFVLYNPPIKPTTVLLWFGPVALFLIGFGALIVYLKRRRQQIEDVPLSEDQLKKAEALLDEKKGKKV